MRECKSFLTPTTEDVGVSIDDDTCGRTSAGVRVSRSSPRVYKSLALIYNKTSKCVFMNIIDGIIYGRCRKRFFRSFFLVFFILCDRVPSTDIIPPSPPPPPLLYPFIVYAGTSKILYNKYTDLTTYARTLLWRGVLDFPQFETFRTDRRRRCLAMDFYPGDEHGLRISPARPAALIAARRVYQLTSPPRRQQVVAARSVLRPAPDA